MYNRMLYILVPLTALYQETALHHASIRGHREIVQLLLEKGVDPNARDEVSVLLNSILNLYLQFIPQYVLIHCVHM